MSLLWFNMDSRQYLDNYNRISMMLNMDKFKQIWYIWPKYGKPGKRTFILYLDKSTGNWKIICSTRSKSTFWKCAGNTCKK